MGSHWGVRRPGAGHRSEAGPIRSPCPAKTDRRETGLTDNPIKMSEPFFPTETENSDEAFDAITFAFMDEWEAGDATGRRPTLGGYVRRYPEYAVPLTDFVLGYIRLQRADEPVTYDDALSPEAVRAGARVREALGLSEYVTVDPEAVPSPTFADLMKELNVSVARLSRQLSVKPMFVNRIQRGLLSTWTGATVRLLAEALDRTADEVDAALRASLHSAGPRLAGTHFSAQGGDPDAQAVQGTPRTLAETVDELGFSPEERAKWLADD